MEGVIGILLSLGLLMFLAYRGVSVIILLTICGLSHRQSYKDIFMASLAITVGILSFLI